LNYLNRNEGWEIGVGPSIVIVDKGVAKSVTTTTAKNGIYAFIFVQKGFDGRNRAARLKNKPYRTGLDSAFT
jgi:hypothetical protein